MKSRDSIYDENYGPWGKDSKVSKDMIASAKRTAFKDQLSCLKRFVKAKDKRLLDVGTGSGFLLDVAKSMGFDCYGVEISKYSASVADKKFPGKIFVGRLDSAHYKSAFFDVITLTDFLEHINNPCDIFGEVDRILKPGGLVLIITPDSDSLTRKLMGANWFQYKFEHIFYWNKRSLGFLLKRFNFKLLLFRNNKKRFNLTYYYFYFKQYSFFLVSASFLFVYGLLPGFLRKRSFSNPVTGEFIAVAQKLP
jgi:ubiquinone/menaquinone biosynthesis C-methylase UbiE